MKTILDPFINPGYFKAGTNYFIVSKKKKKSKRVSPFNRYRS